MQERRIDKGRARRLNGAMRSPWKVLRKKPPKQPRDWPVTLLIGGCVVWGAVLVGMLLSSVIW